MSLVGPRPLPERDYEMLEDWHRKRYLVLPGHHRAVAGLGPLGARLRRPRAPRLHLPRALVAGARPDDPAEDDPRRAAAARRLLRLEPLACRAPPGRGRSARLAKRPASARRRARARTRSTSPAPRPPSSSAAARAPGGARACAARDQRLDVAGVDERGALAEHLAQRGRRRRRRPACRRRAPRRPAGRSPRPRRAARARGRRCRSPRGARRRRAR